MKKFQTKVLWVLGTLAVLVIGYLIHESLPTQIPENRKLPTAIGKQVERQAWPQEIVVHRGANHLAPENTYAAAYECVRLGLDYVEIDVQKSWDGVHYIHHDLSLERTTDGWGSIPLRFSNRIDELDAGGWFSSEFAGEPVPRLENYLHWIKGHSKVYLDVKLADLPELVALVHKLEMEEETFFWFWSDEIAQEFRELAPHLNLKMNVASAEEIPGLVATYHPQIIETQIGNITEELVAVCRAHNLKIMAYAQENTVEEFRRIIASPADMVNLDRPLVYLEAWKEIESQNKE